MQNHKTFGKFRLEGYDYSQEGEYFVTICCHYFKPLFGKIVNSKLSPSLVGYIAQDYWKKIPQHFTNIQLGSFVIMPNHVHGIVHIIHEKQSSRILNIHSGLQPQKDSLSIIVRTYKAAVTSEAKKLGIYPVWQPRFHDHIIRNKQSYKRIEEYIENNPIKWEHDCYFGKGEW